MSNSLANFSSDSIFPSLGSGNSIIASIINSIMMPFYAKQWAEAQAKYAEAMLQAKAEERKLIVQSLTQIALSTPDIQIRQQMFNSILIYGMSN